MKGYEILEVFLPNSWSSESIRMSTFIQKYRLDDFCYESEFFGEHQEWYLEWQESDHERDSSQDRLTVWRKKSLPLTF